MSTAPPETNRTANNMVPTQVEYPQRAAWRTFFQTLLAFLPTANGVLLALQSLVTQPPYDGAFPGWVYLAVNGSVLLGAFLSKIAAQIMANPVVNKWIDVHWPRLAAKPGALVESRPRVDGRGGARVR